MITAFAILALIVPSVSVALGVYLGYGYGRTAGYQLGRWDGLEEGYADAMRDGWADAPPDAVVGDDTLTMLASSEGSAT